MTVSNNNSKVKTSRTINKDDKKSEIKIQSFRNLNKKKLKVVPPPVSQ